MQNFRFSDGKEKLLPARVIDREIGKSLL